MTYHTAGELLQGGAAALFSVCWLLFWEGKQGECLGQVLVFSGGWSVSGGDKKKKGGAKHCRDQGQRQESAGVAFLGNGAGSVTVTGQQREQCSNERGQKG